MDPYIYDLHNAVPADFNPLIAVEEDELHGSFAALGKWLRVSGKRTISNWRPRDIPGQSRFMVRHSIALCEIPPTWGQDVNVKVSWKTDSLWACAGQIGPILSAMDPYHFQSCDALKLGWGPVWDIGLGGAWYYLNAFHAPPHDLLADDLNPRDNSHVWRYNTDLPAEGEQRIMADEVFGKDIQVMQLLRTGDNVCFMWNDHLLSREYPIPDWANGGYAGVRVIEIALAPGESDYDFETESWINPPLEEMPSVEVMLEIEGP